ncbi:MAG: PD-(D/E)XK nuclease family protein, partial [Phycisphaerales bacterium]
MQRTAGKERPAAIERDADRPSHLQVPRPATQPRSRTEPSLDAFLPRSGGRLRLSATDIDLYLSCPLRYKFARVFGIPTPKTVNQKFGILIHDLLERFHRDGAQASADQLVAAMETGWEKAGLEDSAD